MITKRELKFEIEFLAEELDDLKAAINKLKIKLADLEKALKPKKATKKATKKNDK